MHCSKCSEVMRQVVQHPFCQGSERARVSMCAPNIESSVFQTTMRAADGASWSEERDLGGIQYSQRVAGGRRKAGSFFGPIGFGIKKYFSQRLSEDRWLCCWSDSAEPPAQLCSPLCRTAARPPMHPDGSENMKSDVECATIVHSVRQFTRPVTGAPPDEQRCADSKRV